MTREEAWAILTEFTTSDSLIKHALGVEAAMRHFAGKYDDKVDKWGVIGLLHDFDYQKWPEPPQHTCEGAVILRQRGVDEEIVGCILSHGEWNQQDYPRDTQMRKVLFAVDELVGFVMAVALVRPDRLAGMKTSSVKKKMKQKSFAAAVNRDDIRAGAELLGCELDELILGVIAALTTAGDELGL